ncbi:MAG: DUF1444 family protein [Planctomycetia bacterium]
MTPDEISETPSPGAWKLCRGPANWFTFRCPEEIEVTQNQTLIELRWTPRVMDAQGERQESGVLLSLVSWWDESEGGENRRQAPDLGLLFPQVVSLQPLPSLKGSLQNDVWTGESRRPRIGCWLSKVFRKRPQYQWRLWTFRHGRLMIVATTQSADRQQLTREQVLVCERLLQTLEIADRPAWPPDVFLKNVLELARHHFPLLQSSVARGFSVRLGHSEIGLSNFYRRYLQQPEEFRKIMLPGLTSMVRLQELSPSQLMPEFHEVRTRVLPMLSPESDNRQDGRVRQPWVGGLSIGYVIDEDDSYRYVHQTMLDTWEISLEDLHSAAIENLQSYAEDHPLEVTVVGEEDAPKMLMPLKPDAYNCSRILDPEFHSRLRGLFGRELVLGLPNRDFFVVVSLKEPDLIQQIRDQVVEDHAVMHHPLTRCLLLISADGVSEYID